MDKVKLTNRESREDMYITWGRIRLIAGKSPLGVARFNKKRLELLVEKFNKDMNKAKIEENYF